MSRYHENVIWQNEAGRWSIGFYKRVSGSNAFSPDYDSEWDDEYDMGEFSFASSGHPSQQSAMNSWHGPNPGTGEVYHWTKENEAEILEFQDMAKACNNPAYAAERKMKIENAKAKKFQTELRDRLREKTITAGEYRVQISANARVVDAYGMSTTVTGNLYAEGDWLLIKYTNHKNKEVVVQVWNTKTRMQGQKILGIEEARPSYSSYRW